MLAFFAVSVFLLGLIVGSFLNVVILRFNTGMSPFRGRSACFHCARTLRWFELLPLVSFIVLRGRCRSCRSSLSFQYPSVEFATGVLFVFAALLVRPLPLVPLVWGALALLIIIAAYDSRHKIVPDQFSYSFAIVALVFMFFKTGSFAVPPLIDLAAGPALFLPFWFLWFLSGGRWIGLGDGKLALGFGWFLGLSPGLTAVTLGFWSGALWSLCALLYSYGLGRRWGWWCFRIGTKPLTMKSEIPFAPFLILGFFIVLFSGVDVFRLDLIFGLL